VTTSTVIWLGLFLASLLAVALAWRHAAKPAPAQPTAEPRAWPALDRRTAELKAEIARLKRQKKRHSHLVAELQTLTNRRLLWEQGA